MVYVAHPITWSITISIQKVKIEIINKKPRVNLPDPLSRVGNLVAKSLWDNPPQAKGLSYF